jgi:hypothetical protein
MNRNKAACLSHKHWGNMKISSLFGHDTIEEEKGVGGNQPIYHPYFPYRHPFLAPYLAIGIVP